MTLPAPPVSTRLLQSAVCCLMLLALAMPARAEQASARGAKPADPLALLPGSPASWSVSKSPAGCYLLSPVRDGSSHLAIGRHPTLGEGVFVVDFPLASAGPDSPEPVLVAMGGREIPKVGRMIANKLLFIRLDPAEAAIGPHELEESGALWLQVRNSWLCHAGRMVGEAVTTFRKTCADAASQAG